MPHKKPAIRVLIAERAVSVADAIARNLSSEGCAITGIATSGEQALEAAIITVPDVVFLDLSLPGQMDSLTVGQTIVQDLNCPVVYMTTNQHPKAIARIHHTNPSGCLIKPFNTEALKFALNQALRNHQIGATADLETPLPDATTWDMQPFLDFLSAVSVLQPLPRVVFAGQVLKLYTETLESACYLSFLCQQQDYAYQIFTWHPQDAMFELFDQRDQHFTDLPDLI
jgi:CheY-like chemotaxis protein